MSLDTSAYQIRVSESLRRDIDRPRFWRHKHPRLRLRYDRVLEMLKQEPYTAARSERLRHDYSGLRSAVLIDQWRLIFKVCEECRHQRLQKRNPLDCCQNEIALPDRTINIIYISNHYT